jgi:iron complex outermembrane receptor protein
MGVDGARDFIRDENGVPVDGFSVIGEPFSYDEETVLAWELGYKANFLQRTFQVLASTYIYDYDDYQDLLVVYDPVRQSGVEVVENAPSARNMGVEFEFYWLPGENLSIGGNYSYTKAEYDKDYLVVEYDDPAIPQSIFGGLGEEENFSLYLRNVNGNPLKGIPTHKASLWGSYTWSSSIGPIWLVGVASYTGEYTSSNLDRELDTVDSRKQLDASLNWSSVNGIWSARLFVDNVFDDIDAISIQASSEGGNWVRQASWTRPRRYGIDVSYRF